MRHAGILSIIAITILLFGTTANSSINFALNGGASASSSNPPGIPEKAIDGSHDASTSNTYWSSGASVPVWWALNLTEPVKVESVVMRIRGDVNPLCYGSPCYNFRIEASVNAIVWDTLFEEVSTTQAIYVYPVSERVYQYFRVFFTHSNDWSQWANIVEFEVWGDSLQEDSGGIVIRVPTDQSTIQDAINAATDFDTILVEPGTYTGEGNQNISFLGKQVTVIGEKRSDSTILDLNGELGFILTNGEDTTAQIKSLSLINSYAAIHIRATIPTIESVRIQNCQTAIQVGDTMDFAGGFRVFNCLIADNGRGVGIHSPFISNNFSIDNSTFTNNGTAIEMGVFQWQGNGKQAIRNCLLVNNDVAFINYPNSVITPTKGFPSDRLNERFAPPSGYALIDSCSIVENDVALSGRFDATNSHFVSNARIFPTQPRNVLFADDCEFRNTTGLVFGMDFSCGVYLNRCVISESDSLVIKSSCELYCGAEEHSDFGLVNCMVTNNQLGIDAYKLTFSMVNTLYANNGGPIALYEGLGFFSRYISNSTLVNNDSSAIYIGNNSSPVQIEKTVIAFNNGVGIEWNGNPEWDSLELFCNDIFANNSNYIGIPDQTGLNGNISIEPLFCDTATGDYTLYSHSPCAPANNSCGIQMGAYGVGCAEPLISELLIDGASNNSHILDHSPLLNWTGNTDTLAKPQAAYEIAVGTDNNWQFAELWNPAPFSGSETSREYNGSPLNDNDSGYIRIRLFDGLLWSNWFASSFRLNTPPTAPSISDTTSFLLSSLSPTLYLLNATDAQNDALSYDYEVYSDNSLTTLVTSGNSAETPDSTGWVVSPPLNEDTPYWWRSRAFDGFEYSGWSQTGSFFTNAMSSSPSTVSLLTPPEPSGKPVFTMLPTFDWSSAIDPDPFDTVRYKLEIAINAGFTFVNTIDSVAASQFTLTDSLEFSKHYWWRVTAFDTDGLSAQSAVNDFWTWTLGDVNHSHSVTVADLTYMVQFLFNGGQPISPLFVGDLNQSCTVTIADLVYLVQYLFNSGTAPKVGCGP